MHNKPNRCICGKRAVVVDVYAGTSHAKYRVKCISGDCWMGPIRVIVSEARSAWNRLVPDESETGAQRVRRETKELFS
jgi:hypothetical protein